MLFPRNEPRQHSFDIFCENVELEINPITNLEGIEIGVAFRMRDDPDGQAVCEQFGNGETDAINRDRTFAGDIVIEIRRQLHFEPIIFTDGIEAENADRAIDVALDEMTINARSGWKCALEINGTAVPQMPQVCVIECFFK